tara:strand:- start:5570 stop:6634 length:1065 start_codon:yes stop_codon:yes gene_type:complete
MEIHQFLPNFHFGDAIGNHTLEIQRILKKSGYKSNIYVEACDSRMSKLCNNYRKHKKVSSSKNVIIFHYSIHSDIFDYVRNASDKKIMIYHNITPHRFFKHFDNHLYFLTKRGREVLESYRNVPEVTFAVSEYNAEELRRLGFRKVRVLPIIVDFNQFKSSPNQFVLSKYDNGFKNIIFVGRITPSKKHEDIIKSFFFYKRYINDKSRLFLVGSYSGMEEYYESLKRLIDDLNICDVIFTGKVKCDELITYYKLSDIFLCMSEHEGFCVPLLEAMYFDIPIIAYSSTGIPYTLGESGILLKEKNYLEIAELIDLVISDKVIRDKIISNQKNKLSQFETDKVADKFIEYIEEVKP